VKNTNFGFLSVRSFQHFIELTVDFGWILPFSQNWHASCYVVCINRDGPETTKEMGNIMLTFEQISSKIFATASALVVSAVLMAAAIAPATQSIAQTGMMA
jgi:hypothetical protein